MSCLQLYEVRKLNLVSVVRYDGKNVKQQEWTFLGYDIVECCSNGEFRSIFDEESKYQTLKYMNGNKKYYDYSGINAGDVRIKIIEKSKINAFGKWPLVSKDYIENWIEENIGFYFLHYKPEKEDYKKKVKGSLKKIKD